MKLPVLLFGTFLADTLVQRPGGGGGGFGEGPSGGGPSFCGGTSCEGSSLDVGLGLGGHHYYNV
jgi:hypothetical protein